MKKTTTPKPPIYSDKEVYKLALRLYDEGFNVIPVDINKKPLTAWSPRERIDKETLKKKLREATGIAIVGGSENPFKPVAYLVVVDVDRPSALEKYPSLKELISKTVRWSTGPRCPRCENKHLEIVEPGKRFRCSKCGVEFSIDEAKRGLGALFTISEEDFKKYFKGSRRGEDIEFLINNYQLIPPSLHPSGVVYEWINPIDFNSSNYGIVGLESSEVEAILSELKSEPIEKVEPEKVGEKKLRELADSELLKLKELLIDAYKPGSRQLLLLYLSGWFAKARVSPLSIVKLAKMLYDETND